MTVIGLKKQISPEIVKEIVELRKQKTTLEAIRDKKNVSVTTISKILRRELGDSYDDYICKKTEPITPSLKSKVVKLRNQFNTIRQISEQKCLAYSTVKDILLEEFGKDCEKYNLYKTISEETARTIVMLKNKGYKIYQISLKTRVSTYRLDTFFKDSSPQVFKDVIKKLNRKITNEVREEIFNLYHKLWDRVGIHYKKAIRLLPVVIYIVFKIKGLPIHSKEIISSSNLTQKQFRNCLQEVVKHCPEYVARDRKEIVYKKLFSVKDHFQFDSKFVQVSDFLLKKFWSKINNTKDNILAGVISVLTMVRLGIKSVCYYEITNYLNIGHSTVYYQVRNKILKPLGINGFGGFKKSPELLLPFLTA